MIKNAVDCVTIGQWIHSCALCFAHMLVGIG